MGTFLWVCDCTRTLNKNLEMMERCAAPMWDPVVNRPVEVFYQHDSKDLSSFVGSCCWTWGLAKWKFCCYRAVKILQLSDRNMNFEMAPCWQRHCLVLIYRVEPKYGDYNSAVHVSLLIFYSFFPAWNAQIICCTAVVHNWPPLSHIRHGITLQVFHYMTNYTGDTVRMSVYD